MKPCLFLTSLLLLAGPAEAARTVDSSVLSAKPTTQAGLVEYGMSSRTPASNKTFERAARNRSLCEKIEPGQNYMIQNSLHEWEDKVVKVVDKFEDCSVRVQLENGKKAFVRFKNLADTLVPEVNCVKSHGTDICKGDQVFYPARTSSIALPEAPVTYAFAHGVVVVRDGVDFVLDAEQVGKSVQCSPQKESVCVGDYVFAEGFKVDKRFNFEGSVLKAYTHGVVVIEADKFWNIPIDVSAVKKRVASADGENDPAVITKHNSRGKETPFRVLEEVEPGDNFQNDKVHDAR